MRIMTKYSAFLICEDTRQMLLEKFPASYPRVRADHITFEFGAEEFGALFHPSKIEVTGMVDDGKGMQALIVTVDGQQYKPNGSPYHITLSYDTKQKVREELGQKGKYRASIANDLVKHVLENDDSPFFFAKLDPPLEIKTYPALVEKHPDGSKTIQAMPQPVPTDAPRPPSCS